MGPIHRKETSYGDPKSADRISRSKISRRPAYPAAKPQILERARERGADDETLRALGGLPEREYPSPIALSCEVGRIAQAS